jgi:manganese-dependent inorganic pyrophosphatase
MEKVTILSHTNQDTDATCASLALAEFLTKAKLYRATAKISHKPNRETKYVLKRFKQKSPSKVTQKKKPEKVFLVDFNEEEQSPLPFKKIDIEGLIDHHKLNITFSKDYPIIFRVEPIGSSSSIVFKMFKDYDIKITKNTAGLLLAGIISDTLEFSSPTTTIEDEKIAKELEKTANVKSKELAKAMFEAKSDLTGMSAKKIITTDYKEFHFGKIKTGIGVLETVNPKAAFKIERQLRKALSEYKKKQKLDLIFFGLVDIIENNTDLLIIGEEEEQAAQKVFNKEQLDNGIMRLDGVVSRKKQIVPEFTKHLK